MSTSPREPWASTNCGSLARASSKNLAASWNFPSCHRAWPTENSFSASHEEVVTWLTGRLAFPMLRKDSPRRERSLSESVSMALSRTSSRPRAVTRIVST